jgi:hypothetical protein
VIRLTSSWTSKHLLRRLHKRLNRARRRNFIAFDSALEIRASIGVHHGGDAHRREPPSQLRKLDLGELVLYAESLAVRLVLAYVYQAAARGCIRRLFAGFSGISRIQKSSGLRLTLNSGMFLGE